MTVDRDPHRLPRLLPPRPRVGVLARPRLTLPGPRQLFGSPTGRALPRTYSASSRTFRGEACPCSVTVLRHDRRWPPSRRVPDGARRPRVRRPGPGRWPASPTGPRPERDVVNNIPVLTWDRRDDAATYDVQVSSVATFSTSLWSPDGTYNDQAAPARQLPAGTVYWRVRRATTPPVSVTGRPRRSRTSPSRRRARADRPTVPSCTRPTTPRCSSGRRSRAPRATSSRSAGPGLHRPEPLRHAQSAKGTAAASTAFSSRRRTTGGSGPSSAPGTPPTGPPPRTLTIGGLPQPRPRSVRTTSTAPSRTSSSTGRRCRAPSLRRAGEHDPNFNTTSPTRAASRAPTLAAGHRSTTTSTTGGSGRSTPAVSPTPGPPRRSGTFQRTWPDQPQPRVPRRPAATVGDPFYYQWTPVPHASRYEVQLSANPSFTTPTTCETRHTTLTPVSRRLGHAFLHAHRRSAPTTGGSTRSTTRARRCADRLHRGRRPHVHLRTHVVQQPRRPTATPCRCPR